MKAVRVHTPGGPEALRYEDVAEPTPAAGQAVVKLGACGVNFIDVYFRTGQYKAAAADDDRSRGRGHGDRGRRRASPT